MTLCSVLESNTLFLVLLYVAAIFVFILVAVFLVITVKILFIRWKYSHIPSPKTKSFLLGHLYEIIHEKRKSSGNNYPIDYLILKWYNEVGGLFVIFNFLSPLVLILKPDDAQAVYTNPSIRKNKKTVASLWIQFGDRYFGDALFAQYDIEKWKTERQKLVQIHDRVFLKSLAPRFCDCMKTIVSKMKPFATHQTELDLSKKVFMATTDLVTKVFFLYDIDAEWGVTSPEMSSVAEQNFNIYSLSFLVMDGVSAHRNQFFFQYLHPAQTECYRQALRKLRSIGRDCIEKRKRLHNKGNLPNDSLTRLLNLSSLETNTETEAVVDVFIALFEEAGKAIYSVTSFTILQILINPDVKHQLVSEIDEVLDGKDDITIEELEKMKYADQVLQEALRLYTPAGPVPRECPKGGITLSGYRIPPGTTMWACRGVLCRIPEYFEDPETFKPSRFSLDKSPESSLIFPFGLGPRSCLGKDMAMTAIKIILVQLFYAFEIELAPGFRPPAIPTEAKWPPDEIPCTIALRK